ALRRSLTEGTTSTVIASPSRHSMVTSLPLLSMISRIAFQARSPQSLRTEGDSPSDFRPPGLPLFPGLNFIPAVRTRIERFRRVAEWAISPFHKAQIGRIKVRTAPLGLGLLSWQSVGISVTHTHPLKP